ncbi:MAG: NADH:ubiquinone reductase (Na(+)-transporting) subunit E [Planctomycetes bacterium]|nr:NADH:ubiquinone reductase (Na(+)-transporting) subunit E [Planctomycetota bacterium]
MTPGQSLFVIFFAAALTNNILLVYFLGMCPFLGCSREVKTALGLGGAVIFVITCTSGLNWLVYHFFLEKGALTWLLGSAAEGLDLAYLRFIIFIVVIAAFVQFVEIVIERVSMRLYYALGVFLPLITVNCAILGVSLFMVIRQYTFLSAIAYGAGSGVGWALAIVTMAGIRERMKRSQVPKGLEGPGITLIIAGIMALAFMGFSGMIAL